MRNKSIGINVVGLLLCLIGFYTAFSVCRLYAADWEAHLVLMRKYADQIILKVDALRTEPEQEKLRASGNFEKFNSEYKNFIGEVESFPERYIQKAKIYENLMIFTGIITVVFSLLAGVGLMAGHPKAAKFVLPSSAGFGIFYVLGLCAMYPILAFIRFIAVSGNRLNLLVDPAYTDLSASAGGIAPLRLMFGSPMILAHIVVLLIVVGLPYYVARNKEKGTEGQTPLNNWPNHQSVL